MTVFECEEPADFMHLMLTLRESEASRYTERDTPIFVGTAMEIRAALDPLDGAGGARRGERLSRSVCWSRQMRNMAKPQSRARARNATRRARRGGRPSMKAPMADDDQHAAAVEHDLRAARPRRDVAAPLAPDEVDEDGDREEEGDPRRSAERDAAPSPASQHDDDEHDHGDDQEPPQRRVHVVRRSASSPAGQVCPHGERRREQGSSGEPRSRRRGSVGRVEPRREHGRERKRAVRVVELVGGAPVVREQQQTEPDLSDEQRLDEREQMAEDRAALRRRKYVAPPQMSRRPPPPGSRARRRWAPSTAPTLGAGSVVEEGQQAPDFELPSDSRERYGSPSSAAPGRPLLLSARRHAGLHEQACAIRDSYDEFEAARRRRPRREHRRREVTRQVQGEVRAAVHAAGGSDHEVADAYGVWKEKNFGGKKYWGIERSTFVIDDERPIAKVMRRVKPDTHAESARSTRGTEP